MPGPLGTRLDTMAPVDAATILRRARRRAGLTLRALAERAGTSHTTLSAYEQGTKTPRVDTVDRILRAAGFEAEVRLMDAARPVDRVALGRELAAVLDLAGHFPARHSPTLEFPPFPSVRT